MVLPTRRQASALLCHALACAQVGMLAVNFAGCSDRISGGGAGTASGSTVAGVLGSQDIGAAVFQVYRDQTRPLIDYYVNARANVQHIAGDRSVDDVQRDLVRRLEG